MSITRVYEAAEAEDPFQLPGLTEEVLLEALRAGQALFAEATRLDAPTRGGSEAYFETVKQLRIALIPHGWTVSNERNFCRVISPDGRHAIAIAKGTEGTGIVDVTPQTARAMGPVTGQIVAANVLQLEMFDVPQRNAIEQPLTWLLLSRRRHRKQGDQVFAELSLPEARTEAGVVCTWRQRYILPILDLAARSVADSWDDETGSDSDSDSDSRSEPAVDVPVKLRR